MASLFSIYTCWLYTRDRFRITIHTTSRPCTIFSVDTASLTTEQRDNRKIKITAGTLVCITSDTLSQVGHFSSRQNGQAVQLNVLVLNAVGFSKYRGLLVRTRLSRKNDVRLTSIGKKANGYWSAAIREWCDRGLRIQFKWSVVWRPLVFAAGRTPLRKRTDLKQQRPVIDGYS